MKTLIRTLAVYGVLAVAARAQTTVYWNFSAGTGDYDVGVGLPSNITGPGVISGNNGDPGYTPAFNVAQPSMGYSGLQGLASGTYNASIEVQGFVGPINSLADAINPTATYFEFSLAPSAGYALQASAFELGSRSKPGGGGAGPTTLTLVASTDSFASNFTQLGTTTVSTGSWALATILFSTTTWAVDSPVTFRIYGTDGTGGIGAANWRIDDVTLGVVAVPEPPTYAAMLLGGALLGLRAWRRRKSPVA